MSAREDLASELQKHHQSSALSVEELARGVGMDPGILRDVFRGRLLLTEVKLKELLKTMNVSDRARQRALLLHRDVTTKSRTRRQRTAERPPVADWHASLPAAGEPDPVMLSTAEEFVAGLEDVRIWAGEPSLRRLEERSLQLNHQEPTTYGKVLARSTISDMLNASTLPQLEKVRHFLQLCGVRDVDAWVYTWRRIRTIEKSAARRAA
ncbi:multiprotein-bridging factor 1 family protein [Kitasatospora sp. NPDC056651]|uniref:helix-turn-helix domain-containing protein n=1 Tax=Kitasatospora sp. NPDC056651 TaxID=3345892 RepID=UPI0036973711